MEKPHARFTALFRLIRPHQLRLVCGLVLFATACLLMMLLLAYLREQSVARRFQALGGDVKDPVSFESIGPRWLSPSTASQFRVFQRISGLVITDNPIPSDLLSEIGTLRSLKSLRFNFTKNTDELLGKISASLSTLPSLREIYFEGTDVTGNGLAHLNALTNLDALYLSGLQINDADMEHLRGLKNLRFLGLDDTSVGDNGLEALKSFNKLENLNLAFTMVTDDGIQSLTKMTSLRRLEISEQITEEGWNQLRTSLPNCEIGPKPTCQIEPHQ